MTVHLNRQLLKHELTDTWLGLDRLDASNGFYSEPPAIFEKSLDRLPGVACNAQTLAMNHLERPRLNGSNSFWKDMASAYEAFFSWRLADLGTGSKRTLLWRGTALIERNFSFTWQRCAPAAAAVVLFRADRWRSQMLQAITHAGRDAGWLQADFMQRNLNLFGLFLVQLQSRSMPEEWVHAIKLGEHRYARWSQLWRATLRLQPEDSAETRAIRIELERYVCHASVGMGILPLVAEQPAAADKLIRAGRRTRWRRSSPPLTHSRSKLGFLFMVYDRLNFPIVWKRFFADAHPGKFKIVVHASEEIRAPSLEPGDQHSHGIMPEIAFFKGFEIRRQPSSWFNISSVVFSLLQAVLQDPNVAKVVLLSQDTIPLSRFASIHSWASADRDASWLCMDHENTRAEPWVLLTRPHVKSLVTHRSLVAQLMQNSGMCDAEDMIPRVLHLLMERKRLRNRCVVYTQWPLPKYFALGPAPLGRPPALIGEYRRQIGACGHPTTFENLTEESVRGLLGAAHPQRSWFGRKFARSATVEMRIGTHEPLETFLMKALFD